MKTPAASPQRHSAWTEYLKPRAQARIRLLCLPHGGGAALSFRDWQAVLPDSIEVWPIQLPARGRRVAEPAFRQLGSAVDALESALLPLMDRPYALYGYSMGALLAFELARRAETRGWRPPAHLFCGARGAPHLPLRTAPTFALPHAEFIQELRDLGSTPNEILDDADLLEFFLPTIRADFELAQTYAFHEGPLLGCPVTVFGGEADSMSPPEDMPAWQARTTASCRAEIYPGGHFFIREHEKAVLSVIGSELVRHQNRHEYRQEKAASAAGIGA